MFKDELPLQTLFTSLRKAGFPLGIDEYKVLIEALAKAKELGITDREAFKRFCGTLWVKSADDKIRFDAYFEQIIPEITQIPEIKPKLTPISSSIERKYLAGIIGGIILFCGLGSWAIWQNGNINKVTPINLIQQTPTTKPTSSPKQTPPTNLTSSSTPIVQLKKEGDKRNQEIILLVSFLGLGVAVISAIKLYLEKQRQRKQKNLSLTSKSQIIAILPAKLTTDYLPFTPRQMKQTWRYWRCLVRSGKPTELDIDATIRAISRQGFLINPVLLSRQVNRTQLLLLLDGEGSMIPFHGLCHQLGETALFDGNFQQVLLYYFYNCPQGYLYQDSSCLQGVKIAEVLKIIQSQYTGILIVSDGGALRGNLNLKRLEATQKFLTQLRKVARKIAWLNPLPPKRWTKTTAHQIAQQVPMFELNRQGLEKAVTVLRGIER